MIIKRSFQCKRCNKYTDIYINERVPLKEIKLECKCKKRKEKLKKM